MQLRIAKTVPICSAILPGNMRCGSQVLLMNVVLIRCSYGYNLDTN